MIWKFELLLLSLAQSTPDLLKLPEYLNCPGYHEGVFLQK